MLLAILMPSTAAVVSVPFCEHEVEAWRVYKNCASCEKTYTDCAAVLRCESVNLCNGSQIATGVLSERHNKRSVPNT